MKVFEKSKSRSQQRFFGMIAAFKNGQLDTKGLKPEYLKKIKKTAADMSTQDVEDFAETKHAGLPKKVNKKSDSGLSTQVYPDKKENKIVRFEDFEEINEIADTLKRLGRKIHMPDAEKTRMSKAREMAHKYAKEHHTYNRARKHFLANVVNSPYSVNTSNSFIEEFWSELKKIFPS